MRTLGISEGDSDTPNCVALIGLDWIVCVCFVPQLYLD